MKLSWKDDAVDLKIASLWSPLSVAEATSQTNPQEKLRIMPSNGENASPRVREVVRLIVRHSQIGDRKDELLVPSNHFERDSHLAECVDRDIRRGGGHEVVGPGHQRLEPSAEARLKKLRALDAREDAL